MSATDPQDVYGRLRACADWLTDNVEGTVEADLLADAADEIVTLRTLNDLMSLTLCRLALTYDEVRKHPQVAPILAIYERVRLDP